MHINPLIWEAQTSLCARSQKLPKAVSFPPFGLTSQQLKSVFPLGHCSQQNEDEQLIVGR